MTYVPRYLAEHATYPIYVPNVSWYRTQVCSTYLPTYIVLSGIKHRNKWSLWKFPLETFQIAAWLFSIQS